MKNLMMRRVLLLAVSCAGVALSVTDITAYTPSGRKWGTNEVRFYVNPRNMYVSETAALTAIQDGAAAWTVQSRANFRFVYAGYTSSSTTALNYKNEVFFRNEPGGGMTYWWHDGAGKMLDFDIVFYEASRPLFTGSSGCVGGIYVEDLATHEFGHALGLSHAADGEATMYPTTYYCSMNWRELSADDIAGVEALYPPAGSPQPPAAPSQLSVAAGSPDPTSSLSLSWADNASNESGIRIERSLDGYSFVQIAQVGTNVRSYTSSGLTAGTAYFYRVSAFNGDGASGYSNTASGQTQTETPAAIPSGPTLNVKAYKTKGSQAADLAWSGLSSATVDVYRDGGKLTTTPNDGAHTDNLNRKGGGAVVYKACEAGTNICSNSATAVF